MNDSEIAHLGVLAEQNTAHLTRTQKLKLRNEIIMVKLITKSSVEDIQAEYRLSRRQVYNIIEEAQKDIEDWFYSFPKHGMLAIFKSNVLAVMNEITELLQLKKEADKFQDKLAVREAIIKSRILLNRMVAEGPAYVRLKQLVEQSERTT